VDSFALAAKLRSITNRAPHPPIMSTYDQL
jgi:hypothetical protein